MQLIDLLRNRLLGGFQTPGINPNAPPTGVPPQASPQGMQGRIMQGIESPLGQIGLQMLANSRDARGNPVSLGQSAGNAVLGYQQQQRDIADSDLRKQYMQAQIKQMGLPDPARAPPQSIQEYEYAKQGGYTGSYQDWLTTGSQAPKQGGAEVGPIQIARMLAQNPDDPAQVRAALERVLKMQYDSSRSEPLMAVQTPNGPVLMPRSEAAYQPPARSNENVSEGERKAAALGTRLEGALRELSGIKETNPTAETPTWGEKIAGKVPIFGEEAANLARSPDRQRTNAAQLDALDAALTLATGAAYTKEQLENLRTSYFPQLLDNEETRKAKQDRFNVIVEAARIAAGRAAPSINKALDNALGGNGEANSGWKVEVVQ